MRQQIKKYQVLFPGLSLKCFGVAGIIGEGSTVFFAEPETLHGECTEYFRTYESILNQVLAECRS